MSERAAVAGSGGIFIGPPAAKLGIRTATLRTWEHAEPLGAAPRDWHGRLSARGRAMPTGAAELEAYFRERG